MLRWDLVNHASGRTFNLVFNNPTIAFILAQVAICATNLDHLYRLLDIGVMRGRQHPGLAQDIKRVHEVAMFLHGTSMLILIHYGLETVLRDVVILILQVP